MPLEVLMYTQTYSFTNTHKCLLLLMLSCMDTVYTLLTYSVEENVYGMGS